MKIVADSNIPGVEATFGRHGDIVRLEGRGLQQSQLREADVLIIRSVTPVNEKLLSGTPVAFVGTTTIGIDHLDVDLLSRSGICWASAPGCNADAAAQYTLAMIVLACKRLDIDLAQLKCGVVGSGNVGCRVQRLLNELGVKALACDPPLAAAGRQGLVSMGEILQCQLISLHVPLTRDGPCPTYHLIGATQLGQLAEGSLIVNASRGDVINGPALNGWLAGKHGHAALDVWPDEPRADKALVRRSVVATPHVAGHSMDGKLGGTRLVYEAFVRWVHSKGPTISQQHGAVQPLPRGEHLLPDCANLADCILTASEVGRDDKNMRNITEFPYRQRASAFDRLRSEYPPRRDFQGWQINQNCPADLCRQLIRLGFAGPPRIVFDGETV